MPPQTSDLSPRADGGTEYVDNALTNCWTHRDPSELFAQNSRTVTPPRVIVEPTFPELQTDGQSGNWPCSDPAECFDGIPPEELKIMMELMGGLVGATEKEIEAPPVRPARLRLRTLTRQVEVTESCSGRLSADKYFLKEVRCRRRILSLMPTRHVAMKHHPSEFSDSLIQQFMRLVHLTDINQAIQFLSQAMQLPPDGHLNKPDWLNRLGGIYRRRFERSGDLSDVDNAIECHTQAVQLTPDDHPDKPGRLINLGISYQARFQRLGKPPDLVNGIECLTLAVQLTPDGHPEKLSGLNNLGISYMCRFECLGELSDLINGIECLTLAVQLTPDGHTDKPAGLNNLGNSYRYRFERFGDLSDMDNAIECHTQAVQLTPDTDPDQPGQLINLGSSYMYRFKRLGQLSDLANGIECHTLAVQLTPDGHPAKPAGLNNLGNSYRYRFERFGDLSDVDNAIECLTKGAQLTPDGCPDKSTGLNNLGNSYLARFEHLGELSDLDNGIECYNTVIQLTPDGHIDKPARLQNLGSSYQARFKRLGELSDLDNAIKCKNQAVQLTPDGHTDKPAGLNNLGTPYQDRFQRLGELSDLDKAIQCKSQAVQLSPDDHPEKPIWLSNLGNSYHARFERLGELSDLVNGIECHTQAVQLTPDGHPDKSAGLNNLGNSYRYRFERFRELPDLDNGIKCYTQAVQLTPDDHQDRPGRLSNLGNLYTYRFERLDQLSDLVNGIECHTLAVQLTPDGHPDKPLLLACLGALYLLRFKRRGEHAALQLAQSTYQQGAQLTLTSPKVQLQCARSWAETSSLLSISPLEAYERCMELVPHLVWLGATINHRYTLLSDVSSLATEAASWAIAAQCYDLAIEWLEEGRSIVWNQIHQLRTPFDDLSAVHPALALHLKHVASQLEASGTRQEITSTLILTGQSSGLEKSAQHHRQLAAEWEKRLNEARSIPGFDNFMRRRKASELKLAAKDGPVVLINAYSARWDALVISPGCDNITHIPLDKLPQNELGRLPLETDLSSLSGHRSEWDRAFKRVIHGPQPEDPLKVELAALWLRVVKPILDTLECTRKLPINELPHVTWCATGPLALVPLHAAGPYNDSSLNAFDLAISSYTPSLSALLASSAPATQPNIRVLAVGQENTPGLPPLPSTVSELAAIKQHVPSNQYLQLDSKNATVEAVLTAMDKHSWVHLACHATQDPGNPVYSAFHLHDGALTLEAITKRQFKNKGFAFLSACQTAKGDGKLPDEAIHLAAGMITAGYPSVIATMWSIADRDGPEVAGRVYAEMLKDGEMNHKGAARALHQAVAELREKIGVDSFRRWVPFIHIGV